ncbi:hypothetical protein [Gorillibacterium sp. CAU 1737]|uniref:hypothetical protein n=1 Tax=Gorillibacterium sp. CAU 1737 TaxID=3140362 RepID=UPI0032619C9B
MTDWEWAADVPAELAITRAECRVEEREARLTWNWPKGLQFVYVYGFAPSGEADSWSSTLPAREQLKLYTREEYKANGGYRLHLDRFGLYAFRIYPAVREEGTIRTFPQQEEGNEALFSMGKARIQVAVKYRGTLFSKTRIARMTVTSDVVVPKEALCYVKKTGSLPLHSQDGVAYPLLEDLEPGVNTLPDIEIGKEDWIRLFFTDGKRYGEGFDLIHS